MDLGQCGVGARRRRPADLGAHAAVGRRHHAGRARQRQAGTGECREGARGRAAGAGLDKQELDTTAQQLDDATQPAAAPPATSEEDQSKDGTAALVAAGALVTGLARELGATQEDVAATEEELADAQKQADTAEQEAAAAKRLADDATDDAEKADAQADQANAERDAAQAKARIAAECGKAYISAFGGLFGSGNVREQVPDVRKDLEGITADCKTAFAGT